MINKQKVNKIVDLIGFLSLNLQRKIQNIKVMKRILCALIAALCLCTCWAGNGKKPTRYLASRASIPVSNNSSPRFGETMRPAIGR